TKIYLPEGAAAQLVETSDKFQIFQFPHGCEFQYPGQHAKVQRSEAVLIKVPRDAKFDATANPAYLPENAFLVISGSSWGVFTIACTIPIALFVGLYMYRIRKGKVLEASLIGAVAVLAATVAGNWIPGSPLESVFSLTKDQTVFALCAYGFIASVLPVWM